MVTVISRTEITQRCPNSNKNVILNPKPKSAGLPGITRQRVGLNLKIFRLNSLLLLLEALQEPAALLSVTNPALSEPINNIYTNGLFGRGVVGAA